MNENLHFSAKRRLICSANRKIISSRLRQVLRAYFVSDSDYLLAAVIADVAKAILTSKPTTMIISPILEVSAPQELL